MKLSRDPELFLSIGAVCGLLLIVAGLLRLAIAVFFGC